MPQKELSMDCSPQALSQPRTLRWVSDKSDNLGVAMYIYHGWHVVTNPSVKADAYPIIVGIVDDVRVAYYYSAELLSDLAGLRSVPSPHSGLPSCSVTA